MSSLPFTEFTADGFRGLRSLEVKDLRGINVFVGGNNSGKTSVLETLALLSNPTDPGEWVHMVRRRDHGRLDESLVTSLRWCFSGADQLRGRLADGKQPLRCALSVLGTGPLRGMNASYSEFMATAQVPDLPALAGLDGTPVAVEAPVLHGLLTSALAWNQASGSGPMPASVSVVVNAAAPSFGTATIPPTVPTGTGFKHPYSALLPYSYQLNTAQVSAKSSLLFIDDDEQVIELMRQFDEDVLKIEVASFSGFRPAIYIKHRKLGVVPLSVFGDAMRRCMLLATTMTSLGKGGVLLLDEIESGIHIESLPKVLKWLADVARQVGVQVFATTHSLDVLDALIAAEVGDEDLSAYRLKQADERTECQHFPFDSLQRLRYERGLDIR